MTSRDVRHRLLAAVLAASAACLAVLGWQLTAMVAADLAWISQSQARLMAEGTGEKLQLALAQSLATPEPERLASALSKDIERRRELAAISFSRGAGRLVARHDNPPWPDTPPRPLLRFGADASPAIGADGAWSIHAVIQRPAWPWIGPTEVAGVFLAVWLVGAWLAHVILGRWLRRRLDEPAGRLRAWLVSERPLPAMPQLSRAQEGLLEDIVREARALDARRLALRASLEARTQQVAEVLPERAGSARAVLAWAADPRADGPPPVPAAEGPRP